MACDICGAKGTRLVDLLDDYKTAEIQQICPACEKVVNNHIWKIRGLLDGVLKTLMRRFMAERRTAHSAASSSEGKGVGNG